MQKTYNECEARRDVLSRQMGVRAHADTSAAASAEQLLYTESEGTHAQIIADREAFDRALKQVHEQFDITERVPKVGGRRLDLYQLYRNVTELGGYAQVNAKKQWRVCDLRQRQYSSTYYSRSFEVDVLSRSDVVKVLQICTDTAEATPSFYRMLRNLSSMQIP